MVSILHRQFDIDSQPLTAEICGLLYSSTPLVNGTRQNVLCLI